MHAEVVHMASRIGESRSPSQTSAAMMEVYGQHALMPYRLREQLSCLLMGFQQGAWDLLIKL